jgi:AcrR family transcriptional regulator
MSSSVRVRTRGRGVGVARSSRGEAPRARVVEMQRSRLLAAALGVVDELGYARTTVAHVTARARVSRRTFYELFANREECLLAALESVVDSIAVELAAAGVEDLPWRERVRQGCWTVLSFLDREPALARVCVVQALRGGSRVLERRNEILAGLARAIDDGRGTRERARACPPLTAEGLVGAAFAIVYGRLLRGEREASSLTELHGELVGMIVLPYLGSGMSARERSRPAPSCSPSRSVDGAAPGTMGDEGDLLAGVPMRLTYRTALVLETIAEHPGISNRLAGEHAGVSDQGQISKLLARLERLGLIANGGEGHARGEANAWTLTPTGVQVARGLRAHAPGRAKKAAS